MSSKIARLASKCSPNVPNIDPKWASLILDPFWTRLWGQWMPDVHSTAQCAVLGNSLVPFLIRDLSGAEYIDGQGAAGNLVSLTFDPNLNPLRPDFGRKLSMFDPSWPRDILGSPQNVPEPRGVDNGQVLGDLKWESNLVKHRLSQNIPGQRGVGNV